MSTTYPASVQTFTDPTGTSTLATGPDHAQLHTNINDTVEALQNTIGTTAGTNILKDFTAGQFPVIQSGGTLQQSLTGGTLTSVTLVTPIGLSDGWIDANETWTYASANTVTVPSGAASKYSVGDRVKLTQTTAKYFVITGVADTVLTFAVTTSYTVANATITDNYYSHNLTPVGYPGWFALTAPTISGIDNGSSGQPTISEFRLAINGRTAHAHLRGLGTKDGSTANFNFPGSLLPTITNHTSRTPLGVAYYQTAGDANVTGAMMHVGGTIYGVFDASITDNTVLSNFGLNMTYEI